MVFTPLVREDPTDFTDISFTVSTSTESNNAQNLYETRLGTMRKSDLVLNEVVLNKHADGTLRMQIETDTRIYHIVDLDSDGIHTRDSYYIDGKDRTLVVMFEARSEIFGEFANKIRNMVEGIGELKVPQG